MGAHVPTVVVVAEVVVVVVLLGPVVVVVLRIGIGSVGIGIVGIGTWAICTRVSAIGCAWPGLSPRTAKLAPTAAGRTTRAKRRRRSDLMMRLHERDREGTIRPRKSARQYPRGGKIHRPAPRRTCE